MLVVLAAVLLPYTPIAAVLGFSALPVHFLPIIAAIIFLYILAAEAAKRVFYRRYGQ